MASVLVLLTSPLATLIILRSFPADPTDTVLSSPVLPAPKTTAFFAFVKILDPKTKVLFPVTVFSIPIATD